MGSFVIFLILFMAIFLVQELKSSESTSTWTRVIFLLTALFSAFAVTEALRVVGIGV